MKYSKNKTYERIAYAIVGLLVVVVLTNIINQFSANGNTHKGMFKYKPIIVITGSMEPVIAVNSISVMKYCDINDLVEGDIVLYNYGNIKITHRVKEINVDNTGQKYLVTKGDANNEADYIRITPDMVEGKIIKTYNEVAPFISKFMVGPGEINPVALTQTLLSLIVFVVVMGMVVTWVINSIRIIRVASKKETTYDGMLEKCNKIKNSVDEIQLKIENIKNNGNGNVKDTLIKARLMDEITNLENNVHDINVMLHKSNKKE